jgi:hypothetical protein
MSQVIPCESKKASMVPGYLTEAQYDIPLLYFLELLVGTIPCPTAVQSQSKSLDVGQVSSQVEVLQWRESRSVLPL